LNSEQKHVLSKPSPHLTVIERASPNQSTQHTRPARYNSRENINFPGILLTVTFYLGN